MVVWFAPCFRQADYSLYVVPFFHSLQYLIFVYRVGDFEVHSHKQIMAERRWAFLAVGLIITGWLAFEAFPGNLDSVFGNERNFGFSFYLLAANVFINIQAVGLRAPACGLAGFEQMGVSWLL